jgi:hypothetical protein
MARVFISLTGIPYLVSNQHAQCPAILKIHHLMLHTWLRLLLHGCALRVHGPCMLPTADCCFKHRVQTSADRDLHTGQISPLLSEHAIKHHRNS